MSFVAFIILFFQQNLSLHENRHFLLQAHAFLNGQTNIDFLPQDSVTDLTTYRGKFFWAEGPFPSLLIIPFVIFGQLMNITTQQGYVHFILGIGVFITIYQISKKIGYTRFESLFLTYMFCFSTSMFGILLTPWSWYFSQLTSVLITFMIILEYLKLNRPLVLGILIALICATRLHLGFILLTFIFLKFQQKNNLKSSIFYILTITLPVTISLFLLAIYNLSRFETPFQSGYSFVHLEEPVMS